MEFVKDACKVKKEQQRFIEKWLAWLHGGQNFPPFPGKKN